MLINHNVTYVIKTTRDEVSACFFASTSQHSYLAHKDCYILPSHFIFVLIFLRNEMTLLCTANAYNVF